MHISVQTRAVGDIHLHPTTQVECIQVLLIGSWNTLHPHTYVLVNKYTARRLHCRRQMFVEQQNLFFISEFCRRTRYLRKNSKVLAYFSRKLHGAEKRYSTHDKELLAIRDALSRRPDYQEPPIPRMMQMSATRQANAEIELFQLMLDDGEEWRQHTNDCRRQQARGRHYELSSNGLLTHRASGTLVIPNVWSIKERILREAHDSAAGGHFGTLRTHAAVARRFFWPRQFQEIKRYVRGCGVCARTKPSRSLMDFCSH
jgi:hypothetical protein